MVMESFDLNFKHKNQYKYYFDFSKNKQTGEYIFRWHNRRFRQVRPWPCLDFARWGFMTKYSYFFLFLDNPT